MQKTTKTLLCSEQLCSGTLPSGAQRGARVTITSKSGAQRGVRYANHYNLHYSRRYWSFSESKLGKIEQGTQNRKTCTKSQTEIERINMNHTEKIIMQKATEIGNQWTGRYWQHVLLTLTMALYVVSNVDFNSFTLNKFIKELRVAANPYSFAETL